MSMRQEELSVSLSVGLMFGMCSVNKRLLL